MHVRANRIAAVTAWFLVCCGCAFAQNVPPGSARPPAASNPQPQPDLRSLTEALAAMQAQLQALTSQVADLCRQQQESSAEARELRAQLAQAKAQLDSKLKESVIAASSEASVAAAAPSDAASPPSTAPLIAASQSTSTNSGDSTTQQQSVQQQSVEDRLTSLEENQQLNEGKINDQYQTKVESSSKYRLRLTGMLLFNLYDNRGQVDNQDFPEIAMPPDPPASNSAFGGSLRQSRIGLEAFGPDVWGAHTSADIQFDFAGGFPQTENGSTMGLLRLRTGVVRLDWTNTSLVVGQDYLFFAPLTPTSLAQFAQPALSYAGNLWAWTPQVRVEHRFILDHGQKISVSGGILDSFTGDTPSENDARTPTWGEQSGRPAFAARAAWSAPFLDQPFTVGFGGFYGSQSWGFGRIVNGWAVTSDVTMPLGKRFAITGELYRGSAVGGFGGAIGQTVVISGPFLNPSSQVGGLNSMGGWAQLKFKATSKLEFNAAVGDDNPFAKQLREYSSTPSIYGTLLTKNISPFVNFIYQVRSDVLFSVEYQYLRTYSLDSGFNSANHLNLAIGYAF